MKTYRLLRFLLPVPLEESFSAELWARGSLGLELKARGSEIQIDAYFPAPVEGVGDPPDLSSWLGQEVRLLADETLPERDWWAEYRAAAQPIPLGQGFLVDPRDPAVEEPGSRTADGRFVLSIPARNAFGTGSHESTQLAVQWLQEMHLDHQQVLDVGTGSGLLAFIALHLGASRVVGFDLDLPSVISARANAATNRLYPGFFGGRLNALVGRPCFDLALVNILPERILPEIPLLLSLLTPEAKMISSGNLWSRRRELLESFATLGLQPAGEKRHGEWVAFLLTRSRRA